VKLLAELYVKVTVPEIDVPLGPITVWVCGPAIAKLIVTDPL
jgi:hypothetical protein